MASRNDIFVSHSHVDTDRVRGIVETWTQWDLSVDADFMDKKLLDASRRKIMTQELAKHLRDKIRRCRVFVFMASEASASSGWMPWELGLAHGAVGRVHVYLLDSAAKNELSQGREYMKLYEHQSFDSGNARDYLEKVVNEAREEPQNPAYGWQAEQYGADFMEALVERNTREINRLINAPLHQAFGTERGMFQVTYAERPEDD